MTTLMGRPTWAALWADDASPARTPRLTPSLQNAAPSTWIWCFRCERAFQRADLHEGVSAHCAYADCDGGALDFWQWDAYRAFVGGAPVPSRDVRYRMAQGE